MLSAKTSYVSDVVLDLPLQYKQILTVPISSQNVNLSGRNSFPLKYFVILILC